MEAPDDYGDEDDYRQMVIDGGDIDDEEFL